MHHAPDPMSPAFTNGAERHLPPTLNRRYSEDHGEILHSRSKRGLIPLHDRRFAARSEDLGTGRVNRTCRENPACLHDKVNMR